MSVSRNLRSSVSKPCAIDFEQIERRAGDPLVDGAIGLDLREVAHATQQPVGDTRRAARALRDVPRAGRHRSAPSRMEAERVTMRSRSSTP